MRKKALSSILAFVMLFNLLPSFTAHAVKHTINVTDGSIMDWVGVDYFNDPYGDVSGAGPNDLIKIFITNDDSNIYCRWDVILTGGGGSVVKSAAYSLGISSVVPPGVVRPAAEVRAIVAFDSKAVVAVSLENASKTIALTDQVYAEQVPNSTTGSKIVVSIEAKFPLSSFDTNGMTVNPLTTSPAFPLWGETLSSPAFTSNVKDYCPGAGFFSCNLVDGQLIPIGIGPTVNLSGLTTNTFTAPSTNVNYSLRVSNVGDNTGGNNLQFTSVQWILPAGFTYIAGSSTGLATANPTISGQTLTWSGLSGNLAPGAFTSISFRATASATSGTYYSNVILTPTLPAGTFDTGDTAVVNINPLYVPPATVTNLTASNITQTKTSLSWTAVSGATKYNIYKDGVLYMTGVTGTSTLVSGLSPNTSYNFTVKAVNAYELESVNPSNTAAVTTLPAITVTVNNLTTKSATPTLTGTSNAPNGTSITVRVNGIDYTTTVNGGTWSVNVTNAVPEGTYTVTASVLDADGITRSGTGTLVEDRTAPIVVVSSPASGSTTGTTFTITGTTCLLYTSPSPRDRTRSRMPSSA